MIQRKQSLLLLQIIFLGISITLIPVVNVTYTGLTDHISLWFIRYHIEYTSTMGFNAAVVINLLSIALAVFAIFQYKHLSFQRKLAFVVMFLYLILTGMLALCPFIAPSTSVSTEINYLACAVTLVAAFCAWQASKFIKKDIDLLKSVDRIR